MDDFITARRKDDAVVSVCQDNKKKNVLILGLNQAARNLLKYEEGNLLNKPLINILSARAADDMKNYLAPNRRNLSNQEETPQFKFLVVFKYSCIGSVSAVITEIFTGAISARRLAWFWEERSNHF
ncbi:hypothetical protein [Wolbachia endosymbiont (group A) of Myopa testacea]|uniref:hypothetical protein n=1 Tax=Wolbachia endosymbiont (group A) of Myopa testacea TaxID=3066148 RepID=UPI0033426E15